MTENTEKFSVKRGDDGQYHVRRIFNPIKHHQAFNDAAVPPAHPGRRRGADRPEHPAPPLEAEPEAAESREARFEWHQDYPFFPHSNYDLVAVLIHIDEATKENGCLRIIPGSHKQGPQMHVFAKDGAFSSKLADQAVLGDESSWHYAECPAGGVELHHCNMLHSSTANRGTKPRSVLIFQYRAADNVLLGGSWRRVRARARSCAARTRTRPACSTARIVKLPGEIKDPLQRDG